MKKTNDLKIFISNRNSTCDECKEELGRKAWIKPTFLLVLSVLLLVACNKETTAIPELEETPVDSIQTNPSSILTKLAADYVQMPEKEIAVSLDERVYAQYASPTERYKHGILGDRIEAAQLVVVMGSVFYEFTLKDTYVFEDIRPRLYDVDGDGELEFITLRTSTSLGGGIAIYKIRNNRLEEYATVKEIGRSNRWLNIVAINDLDKDGIVELAWIETPHIGGTLKVAKIQEGALSVIAQSSQYSNHAIGEKNLCLSVLTEQNGQKIFYVPNQNRNKIVGFYFKDAALTVVEEIAQAIDFSKTVRSQYNFKEVVMGEDNCINP